MAVSMLITSLSGFLLWIVVARQLDTTEVGALTGIVNSFLLVSAFSQLSLNLGLNRFLPTAGSGASSMLAGVYGIVAISTLVFAAVFVMTPLGDTANEYLSAPFLMIFGMALVWNLFALQDQGLAGLGRSTWIPVENGIFSLARLLVIIPLSALGIGWALAAWWAPALIAVMAVSALLWFKVLPAFAAVDRRTPTVRQFFDYISVNYLSTLLASLFYSGLPIVVLNVMGAESGAAFALAWILIQTADNTFSRFGTSLVISVSMDPSKLRASVRSLMKLLVAAIPVILVLVWLSPQILTLFGPQYAELATETLRILLIAFIGRMVMIIQTSVWRAQDKNWRVAGAYLLQVAPAVLAVAVFRVDSLVEVAWIVAASQLVVCLLLTPSLVGVLRGSRQVPGSAGGPVTAAVTARPVSQTDQWRQP